MRLQMACSNWARIMESAGRMLRLGPFLLFFVEGKRAIIASLLVPDELANLARSIAQQDADELKQDDFDHGHGHCG